VTRICESSTNPTNDSFAEDLPVATPVLADLAVTITASDDKLQTGKPVTYTVTATNLGPDAASDAAITDDLPSYFDLISVTPSSGFGTLHNEIHIMRNYDRVLPGRDDLAHAQLQRHRFPVGRLHHLWRLS
jgi:uncharacterized repeat protein (TIGR01451 family)